jgi:gamma-glutamyl-gamma-aminobutyrate hydrolase PuuD
MSNKILVVSQMDNYGVALEGLGELTDDVLHFMDRPEEYKLVMFTGGEDVSPELYGETSPLGMCFTNRLRDKREAAIFAVALKHGIKMTGICRGTQFINVMSGGRMMHDIKGHGTGHNTHRMETSKGEVIDVNSFHHQMIIPPEDGYVIGWAKDRLSDRYIGDKDQPVEWNGPETEIVLIPRTLCCGVQWHPEWMLKNEDGYIYYNNLVERFMKKDIASFTAEYVKTAMVGA